MAEEPSDGAFTNGFDEDDPWEVMKASWPPMSPSDKAKVEAILTDALQPLGPNDPIRHHYIPQFFQRRFADDEDHLVVTQLDGGESKRLHVSDIAVSRNFYTSIDNVIGETVATEKLLAVIDGLAAPAIRRMVTGVLFPPSPKDREYFTIWLSLLWLRDPHTRRRMEANTDQFYKMDLALLVRPDAARARLRRNLQREPTTAEVDQLVEVAERRDEIEVVPPQSYLVKMMLQLALSSWPYFLHRPMTVWKLPEPGLVFTDRPVVLSQYPENSDPLMGVGVANADEILFPLDRQHLLLLHLDLTMPNSHTAAPFGLSLDEINQVIAGHAAQEVYCHPADVDRLASLTLPDPEKPLFIVDGPRFLETKTDGVNSPPVRKRPRRYRK
jgi:hypothetical protein